MARVAATRSQTPDRYLRHPSIAGSRLVFVSEDDLWTVDAAGGTARRLTANLADTSRPVLSPDGELLAFVGRDEDQPEVWCMPAAGGPARRLTYLGHASTTVIGWTPDGRIVATSVASQPFHRWSVPLLVDPGTGAVERLEIGPCRAISFEPGGPGVVIARHSIDPARWKRYRGGTAGQIWVDRRGDGNYRRILTDLPSDLAFPQWIGNRIYFLSDHEGIGNVYSVAPTGRGLRRHTDHDEFYARFAASDGERIVYQHAADLWVFDPATDVSERVEIDPSSPRVQRNRRFVAADTFLTGQAVHPAGREVMVETRGQIFTMPPWEDAPRALPAPDGVRQRLGRWFGDGETTVCISDAAGEEHLVVRDRDSEQRIELGDIGHVWELAATPIGAPRVALATNRHELHLLDVESSEVRRIDGSSFGALTDLTWSPDAAWLAYSIAGSEATRAIRICEVATGTVTAVTRDEFRDVGPAWSPDGRFLYFLSSRIFDPVQDEFFLDLNFPRTVKPYVVPLRAADRSPFEPAPRDMRDPTPPDPGAPVTVTIDLDGIDRRIAEVPGPTGRYLKIAAVNNAVLVMAAEVEGMLTRDILGDALPSYQFERIAIPTGKRENVMADVMDFAVSGDASTLLVRSQRRLRLLKADELAPKPEPPDDDKPGRASGWLDLGRIRVAVDPGAEWHQMYLESWRLQREYFWDAGMSGVDWERVRDRYLPLVERLGARSELSDLLWEMQGELGTSHAYEMGGEYRPVPSYPVGFLGADLEQDARSGRWRVARIVRADHWDPATGSPLEAPGVGVREGDTILAVNGRAVGKEASPAAQLVNQAGTAVELTVGDARGRRPRRVVVTTVRDEQPMRYRAWVEGRRQYVHDATDGRVGYVHVPDMGTVGYAEFHRSYLIERARDALVIDIRDNRGGFVSALLLEKLARRPLARMVTRWGPVEWYPEQPPTGPMVCVTNQNAGSDGDIFSHSFKLLGLGPLVGVRTWGGVVGIDGRHRLVDGGVVTQPLAAFWFNDVGWAVENYGTDPDVVVDLAPQDWAAGRDPQLDKAIQLVRQALRRHKPPHPSKSPRPQLALPTLPPRA